MYEGDVFMANSLLVALDGKLYGIDCDFCVLEYVDYTCAGAGMEYAYGALHAVGDQVPVEERLKKAILAASAFDKTCGHSVVSVKKGKLNWVGVTHTGDVVEAKKEEPAPKRKPAKKKKSAAAKPKPKTVR